MKFSQFNSIRPHQGKFALYNSLTQQVIFIVPELEELLKAALHEGIDNLEEFHPTFYHYLREQEFIVPDSDDEVEKVKEISRRIDENPEEFLLTINPTMNCNFKCWYCYETHIKQSRLNTDIITRIQHFIEKTSGRESLKTFSLSFFGGEPLLHFSKTVIPLIDHFTETCRGKSIDFSISFTTNGYLIKQEFIDYFAERKIKPAFQITLDGYREDHDKVRFVSANEGSYDEIIKNIRLLIQNRFYVRLRVNYTDKNIAESHRIADEFQDISHEIRDGYLFFDFHRVWQNSSEGNINDVVNENMDSIRDNGFRVQGKYVPNNVLESCYADKRNSAVINYNGDIYKCTARDFTQANRAGYIDEQGELIWENDYLETRMGAKFKNRPCLTCRILPLCNGGCSQHALEHIGEDYCIYNGDEGEKDEVVKAKIEEILRNIDETASPVSAELTEA